MLSFRQSLRFVTCRQNPLASVSSILAPNGPNQALPCRRHFAKKKKATAAPQGASAGRIAFAQQGGSKKGKAVKLCSGCGVEIVSSGRSPSRDEDHHMIVGHETENVERSRKQNKMARYADVAERRSSSQILTLCDRCKSLREGNVWQAYDALRDVDPSAFLSQLRHIVSRRKFGLCISVVDAVDPEFTTVRRLRDAIGKTPCILVVNKIDLLPRMSDKDLRYLKSRVEKRGVRMIAAYAVSAETGEGIVELAEGVLENLGGRDVFVVGSANVGKSTLVKSLSSLLASSIWMKGKGKYVTHRKEVAKNLDITASHLPGTTLQAVRIPCFPSDRHALWDTPGVINHSALDYSLFPSHYMEPLAFPEQITIPNKKDGTKVMAKEGQSILIEAAWIAPRLKDDTVTPFTLARLDIIGCTLPFIEVLAFVPASLNIRVVSTDKAPTEATIPPAYVEAVQERIGKSGNFGVETSRPLAAYDEKVGGPKDGIVQMEAMNDAGWVKLDIVFASLGWLMLSHKGSFKVKPMCVSGSLWSKRRPIYPSNLDEMIGHDGWSARTHLPKIGDAIDNGGEVAFNEIKERLKRAAESGKNHSNRRNREVQDFYGDFSYDGF